MAAEASVAGPTIILDGPLRIDRADGSVVSVPSGLQPLLVLLVLAPGAARTKETVLSALWPDTDPARARARLSTALWRLRGLLRGGGDAGGPEDRGERFLRSVTFDCEQADCWQQLEDLDLNTIDWADASTTSLRLRLESAAMLDTDCLAPGCFHEWVVNRREALRLHSQRALATLATVNGNLGNLDRAIELAELLVTRDALREDGHRSLMQLYVRAGRRGEALRQFDHCRRILETELGIEPMPETVELANAIRDCRLGQGQPAAAVAVAAEPSFPAGPGGLALSVADDVESILQALARARAALEEVEAALGLQPAV